MARRLRVAGREAGQAVASREGLVRMVYGWEKGDHALTERYALLYARALGVDLDRLAGGPVAARVCGQCGGRLARDNGDVVCGACRRGSVAGPPRVPREFWDFPAMRGALDSWHMGRVVLAYRTHPWHGREVSQEVMGGWLGGLTQPQVSKLENGAAVEDLRRLVPWARVLGVPGELLWFRLPAGDAGLGGEDGTLPGAGSRAAFPVDEDGHALERVSSDQLPEDAVDVNQAVLRLALADWAPGGTWDVNEMERRELLRILGAAGLAVPFAGGGHAERVRRGLDSALNAPTTAADVAEWEGVVLDYGARNGRVAPAVLLPELLADLEEAQLRLGGAPDALRPPMARVCGYLSAITANNLVNAGDAQGARRYWRTALRLVGQGGDPRSQAMLYATRARFALAEAGSSPAAALAYADEAIGAAGGVACGGAAQGHAARALALAYLGDHGESATAVQDLGDLSARLPQSEMASRVPFAYCEQSLYFTQSRVYAYAGREADAARAQDAGLALVPRDAPLPLADFSLNAAVGLIRSGDPSEGARHVARTVEGLPVGYRQSTLIRQNAARALDLVPAGAAGLPAVAEAREVLALPAGAAL
jgi:transcriptional regulator with XRE-family HTH domain